MVEQCSESVAETISPLSHVEIATDDSGHLACDLACVECAYNLRGLPPDGKCPECGAPVRKALLGNFLEHASSEWVGSVYRGVHILSWALPATFVISAMWLGVLTVSYATFATDRPFFTGMLTIICFVDLCALMLLTRRESLRVLTKERTIWRRFLRMWAIPAAMAFATVMLAPWFTGSRVWVLLLDYTTDTFLAIYLIGMFGLVRYLVAISDRTRSLCVSTSMRAVGDPAALGLLTALGVLLFQFFRRGAGWRDSDFTDGLNSFGFLLGLAGVIGVCVMIFRVRGILSELIGDSSPDSA